jgi:hypothetical protein
MPPILLRTCREDPNFYREIMKTFFNYELLTINY